MDGKIKELFEKITKYIRPPFRSNDVTDEILEKTGGRGLYAKHEIELSIANSDTDISISGDNLTVEDCPDAVTVKLNHKKNPEIDLQKIPEVAKLFFQEIFFYLIVRDSNNRFQQYYLRH